MFVICLKWNWWGNVDEANIIWPSTFRTGYGANAIRMGWEFNMALNNLSFQYYFCFLLHKNKNYGYYMGFCALVISYENPSPLFTFFLSTQMHDLSRVFLAVNLYCTYAVVRLNQFSIDEHEQVDSLCILLLGQMQKRLCDFCAVWISRLIHDLWPSNRLFIFLYYDIPKRRVFQNNHIFSILICISYNIEE